MWKRTGKSLLLTAIFCFAAVSVFAAEPEVSFSVNQREILLGDSFVLSITVKNVSNPQTPELPEIPGFDTHFQGTRRQGFSSYTVIINGKVQQQNSGGGYDFAFELTPRNTGTFTIPSFTVTAGGKSFASNPFEVRVFAQTEKSDDVFIEVSADKNKVYLGEKIVLTFKWYYNKNIQDYRINVPWLDGLKNFLIADPEFDQNLRYERIVVNGDQQVIVTKGREFYEGQPYTIMTFQKILTPISVGTYSLEPSFIKCDVVTGYQQRSGKGTLFEDLFDADMDNFFSFGRKAVTQPLAARSAPIAIQVSEVPELNRPANYNDAVGEFDFKVNVNPINLKAGDPITLTMKVSGTGNIEQLTLPEIPDLENFKSYEPESRVNVAPKGGEVFGEKIFEKVLVPKREGSYTIPAIAFTFFHPRQMNYKTITQGPFVVQVAKGEKEREVQVVALTPESFVQENKQELKILKKDIRYIKTTLGKVVKNRQQIYENPLIWVLLYLVPGFILGIMVFWQKQRDRLQTDTGFARKHRAMQNTKKLFTDADAALKAKEVKRFYDALSRLLNGYLADKLNLPLGSMNAEIIPELKKSGLIEKHVQQLTELYQTFEMVLFSSVKIEFDKMKQDYAQVKAIIGILEKILR